MSGGTFNQCGYVYYQVSQFADELENEIENNEKEDEWGYKRGYNEKTLEILKSQIKNIRAMSQVMKEIDYLYSGDTSEETLVSRIEGILSK